MIAKAKFNTDFTPIDLTITISTKKEFDILYQLFSRSKESLESMINAGIIKDKQFASREVDSVLVPIFNALNSKIK